MRKKSDSGFLRAGNLTAVHTDGQTLDIKDSDISTLYQADLSVDHKDSL